MTFAAKEFLEREVSLKPLFGFVKLNQIYSQRSGKPVGSFAEVVERKTRSLEEAVPQGVGVQLPPSAQLFCH